MKVLVGCLSVLSNITESLRLSSPKTEVQNFNQAVDQVSSVPCCGEEVDVVDVFQYLGCQITSDWKTKTELLLVVISVR